MAALALILGICLALSFGNPHLSQTKKIIPRLLGLSIMGLGAGMNLYVVAHAGLQGIGLTLLSISFTMLLGLLLGKFFKTEREASVLLSTGTAICGGSAIAAVSAAINAKSENISVSLAVVFFLNALALLCFPYFGHSLGLSEIEFGLWAALAIHDTSSVVGAALSYGPQALETATTVKLARALWIVPLTAAIQYFYHRGETRSNIKTWPWFIIGFILTSAIVTYFPETQKTGMIVADLSKKLLILALFLIGSSLNKESFKKVGYKPFAHGTVLWVLVAVFSLIAVKSV